MKRSTKLALIGSAFACGAAAPRPAKAAGIELYEIGTPDVGLASAGYAARAQDASTVFKNPAGMSLLPAPELQAGLQLLYGSVEFSPDSSTSPFLGGGNGDNAIGLLPGASLFYVHPLSEKLAVGVGMLSYFGLASEYDSDWVGRYYIQKGVLVGVSLTPSISYKATDWLSIGAGLNAMAGYLDDQVAIRTGAPGDGQMTLKDNTWGFGANVGVLIEPCKGTRFGITYLSPVSLDFKDKPSFSNLGPLGDRPVFQNPSQLDLGMTVPQSVMVGFYQELGAKWAVMADVGWQDWSQFGKVDVGVNSDNPQNLTANLNYEDTWHGAIGALYKASDRWTFSGGFAYDSSAVSDQNRTLSTPMGKAWRFGAGVQWQMSKAINLGAAYEYLWAGDMPVVQESNYRGRVAGAFNDAWFSFFAINLSWRF